MSRYRLTIEYDTLGELTDSLRALVDSLGGSVIPRIGSVMPLADPPARGGGVPLCPRGHGEMVMRPAGSKGGRSWPAFYACPLGREQCGETAEIGG